MLRELYETQPSESLQFAIEIATANFDVEAYRKLNSPCGPIISLLQPVDPALYGPHRPPRLMFAFSYRSSLWGKYEELRRFVVLEHQADGHKIVLPSNSWAGGDSAGSDAVTLPKNVPPGKYHVFYQVRDGDKVISTGHYFAVDL